MPLSVNAHPKYPSDLPAMTSLDGHEEDLEMSRRKLLNNELVEKRNDDLSSPSIQGLRSSIVDGACILLNIVSTVVLVFLNKWQVSCPFARKYMY